jgi:hypothetical protein
MLLLLAVAGKELAVAKAPVNNKLLQIENVQEVKAYELRNDEEDDSYDYEFNVGSGYTYLFQ